MRPRRTNSSREVLQAIDFLLDSYWIPIRFLMDSHGIPTSCWSPIGFRLDSSYIPIGEFLQDELVALRMRRVRSRRTNEWRETSQDAIISLDLAGRIHHASLAGRLGRSTHESREISQDE